MFTSFFKMLQPVLIPTVTETQVDDPKEPQFVKVRSNQTSCLYVNDLTNDGDQTIVNNVLSNNNMFLNVKRIKMNRFIMNEKYMPNITSYNNHFKGIIYNEPGHTFHADVDVTFGNQYIGNLTDLKTLFDSKIVTGPPAHPEISFTILLNINQMKMDLAANYSFTFDPECTFFKNGQAMFGTPLQFPTSFNYYLTPTFYPFWYVNIVSNTLSRYSNNRNLENGNIINIIYRYYYGQENREAQYWLNWNKSGITSFDIRILDKNGDVYRFISGAGFLGAEILMEQ